MSGRIVVRLAALCGSALLGMPLLAAAPPADGGRARESGGSEPRSGGPSSGAADAGAAPEGSLLPTRGAPDAGASEKSAAPPGEERTLPPAAPEGGPGGAPPGERRSAPPPDRPTGPPGAPAEGTGPGAGGRPAGPRAPQLETVVGSGAGGLAAGAPWLVVGPIARGRGVPERLVKAMRDSYAGTISGWPGVRMAPPPGPNEHELPIGCAENEGCRGGAVARHPEPFVIVSWLAPMPGKSYELGMVAVDSQSARTRLSDGFPISAAEVEAGKRPGEILLAMASKLDREVHGRSTRPVPVAALAPGARPGPGPGQPPGGAQPGQKDGSSDVLAVAAGAAAGAAVGVAVTRAGREPPPGERVEPLTRGREPSLRTRENAPEPEPAPRTLRVNDAEPQAAAAPARASAPAPASTPAPIAERRPAPSSSPPPAPSPVAERRPPPASSSPPPPAPSPVAERRPPPSSSPPPAPSPVAERRPPPSSSPPPAPSPVAERRPPPASSSPPPAPSPVAERRPPPASSSPPPPAPSTVSERRPPPASSSPPPPAPSPVAERRPPPASSSPPPAPSPVAERRPPPASSSPPPAPSPVAERRPPPASSSPPPPAPSTVSERRPPPASSSPPPPAPSPVAERRPPPASSSPPPPAPSTVAERRPPPASSSPPPPAPSTVSERKPGPSPQPQQPPPAGKSGKSGHALETTIASGEKVVEKVVEKTAEVAVKGAEGAAGTAAAAAEVAEAAGRGGKGKKVASSKRGRKSRAELEAEARDREREREKVMERPTDVPQPDARPAPAPPPIVEPVTVEGLGAKVKRAMYLRDRSQALVRPALVRIQWTREYAVDKDGGVFQENAPDAKRVLLGAAKFVAQMRGARDEIRTTAEGIDQALLAGGLPGEGASSVLAVQTSLADVGELLGTVEPPYEALLRLFKIRPEDLEVAADDAITDAELRAAGPPPPLDRAVAFEISPGGGYAGYNDRNVPFSKGQTIHAGGRLFYDNGNSFIGVRGRLRRDIVSAPFERVDGAAELDHDGPNFDLGARVRVRRFRDLDDVTPGAGTADNQAMGGAAHGGIDAGVLAASARVDVDRTAYLEVSDLDHQYGEARADGVLRLPYLRLQAGFAGAARTGGATGMGVTADDFTRLQPEAGADLQLGQLHVRADGVLSRQTWHDRADLDGTTTSARLRFAGDPDASSRTMLDLTGEQLHLDMPASDVANLSYRQAGLAVRRVKEDDRGTSLDEVLGTIRGAETLTRADDVRLASFLRVEFRTRYEPKAWTLSPKGYSDARLLYEARPGSPVAGRTTHIADLRFGVGWTRAAPGGGAFRYGLVLGNRMVADDKAGTESGMDPGTYAKGGLELRYDAPIASNTTFHLAARPLYQFAYTTFGDPKWTYQTFSSAQFDVALRFRLGGGFYFLVDYRHASAFHETDYRHPLGILNQGGASLVYWHEGAARLPAPVALAGAGL